MLCSGEQLTLVPRLARLTFPMSLCSLRAERHHAGSWPSAGSVACGQSRKVLYERALVVSSLGCSYDRCPGDKGWSELFSQQPGEDPEKAGSPQSCTGQSVIERINMPLKENLNIRSV